MYKKKKETVVSDRTHKAHLSVGESRYMSRAAVFIRYENL
jgi:hypothetical protein